MTQSQLLKHLEKWAAAHQLEAVTDREIGSVRFHFAGAAGEWLCTGLCEQEPLVLQVMCRLPVRVPTARRPATALLLHRHNARLRVGSYALDPQDGEVTFRLPMPIRAEAPIVEQIQTAFAIACGTVDGHLGLLCLSFFDQAEIRQKLEELEPWAPVDAELKPVLRRGRAELN